MTNEPDSIDAKELERLMEGREALVIDVRETHEYEDEHIPGTVLYPLSFLDADLLPPINNLKVVIVCQVGQRSAAAGKQLIKEGFKDVVNLEGGLLAWKDAGLETEGAELEDDFPEPEPAK